MALTFISLTGFMGSMLSSELGFDSLSLALRQEPFHPSLGVGFEATS